VRVCWRRLSSVGVWAQRRRKGNREGRKRVRRRQQIRKNLRCTCRFSSRDGCGVTAGDKQGAARAARRRERHQTSAHSARHTIKNLSRHFSRVSAQMFRQHRGDSAAYLRSAARIRRERAHRRRCRQSVSWRDTQGRRLQRENQTMTAVVARRIEHGDAAGMCASRNDIASKHMRWYARRQRHSSSRIAFMHRAAFPSAAQPLQHQRRGCGARRAARTRQQHLRRASTTEHSCCSMAWAVASGAGIERLDAASPLRARRLTARTARTLRTPLQHGVQGRNIRPFSLVRRRRRSQNSADVLYRWRDLVAWWRRRRRRGRWARSSCYIVSWRTGRLLSANADGVGVAHTHAPGLIICIDISTMGRQRSI